MFFLPIPEVSAGMVSRCRTFCRSQRALRHDWPLSFHQLISEWIISHEEFDKADGNSDQSDADGAIAGGDRPLIVANSFSIK